MVNFLLVVSGILATALALEKQSAGFSDFMSEAGRGGGEGGGGGTNRRAAKY